MICHRPSNSSQAPEVATAHVAKKIKLDLNDPNLLLDHAPSTVSSSHSLSFPDLRHPIHPGSSRRSGQKYNISNDEAYDLLKENHQHKIRGMLGNLQLEHSMVALRLQWPFVSRLVSLSGHMLTSSVQNAIGKA